MKKERHETMRATMQPDMYGGKTCDQLVPRWWCYADGDKDGDYDHKPLTLDPAFFPPGTVVSVEEPVCPECGETRSPDYKDGKFLPGFAPKCHCGFNWEAWVADEFS